MLDLRRLRVLRAVVASGSVTAAAGELHLTPSAVSQAVALLERETGTPLLERAGRGVRPTDAARLLAEAADDVLTRLAEAEGALAALREGRTGRLALTSFPSAGASLVPPAVVALRRRHPDVELVLGVAEPDDALRALRDGGVDVAVVVEPFGPDAAPDDDLARTHLLDDPYEVLLPLDHPLAGSAQVDLALLAGDPWVSTGSTPGWCQEISLGAFRRAGFAPAFVVEADDFPATQGFVAAGLGVAIVPRLALGLAHERVARARLQGEQTVRHVYAATRATRAGEALLASAVTALRDAARAPEVAQA